MDWKLGIVINYLPDLPHGIPGQNWLRTLQSYESLDGAGVSEDCSMTSMEVSFCEKIQTNLTNHTSENKLNYICEVSNGLPAWSQPADAGYYNAEALLKGPTDSEPGCDVLWAGVVEWKAPSKEKTRQEQESIVGRGRSECLKEFLVNTDAVTTANIMDYSKFSDENFDVKEWVNGAFRAHKEGNKDQYASTLVMKLQMFIQEVNSVIEDSCQEVVQNLPRVCRELDAVRQEAALLQEQMTMVRNDIEKVEQDTSQSMQTLLNLDTVKTRMQESSDALREADNWTTLSTDVDEVFESKDINAISAKLTGMQQSLQMLTDVPDYAEHVQFLETLKNRLEATLSPQIVAAFSTQNTEEAQKFVTVFTQIDRLPQLYKYYHKCNKTKLLEAWRDITSCQGEEPLTRRLDVLYDNLLTAYNQQLKWCSQLFVAAVPIVCDLLTETLTSLDPSIPSCLEVHLAATDDAVQALITVKQISERFLKNLEQTITNHSSEDMERHHQSIEKLAMVVYAPYKLYILQYGNYESQMLASSLDNIMLDHEDILECVQLLADSVSKLFEAAEKACSRCVTFTNGCGFTRLLKAYKEYFGNYVQEVKRVVNNLREKCRPESGSMDADDWTWFQHSLRIIQTCGDLILHVDELDQTLVTSIINSIGKYSHLQPSSPLKDSHISKVDLRLGNPFQDYTVLLLDKKEDRNAVETLYTALEEGDTPSVLMEVKAMMCGLSEIVHKFAFDIVFSPLNQQLSDLPNMQMWTSETAGGALATDLPTFSLSPQEYITKVGQYLLTLPQQLEPFTVQDNPSLCTAIKHGKLPYTAQQDMEEHLADLWLESVARGTMHFYTEQILRIPQLTHNASKQLLTDIDYLVNVLDDLGLQSSENLKNVSSLLKASEDEFSDIAENMPQRLASAVASMRSLKSH